MVSVADRPRLTQVEDEGEEGPVLGGVSQHTGRFTVLCPWDDGQCLLQTALSWGQPCAWHWVRCCGRRHPFLPVLQVLPMWDPL